jgi:hypothetical protein
VICHLFSGYPLLDTPDLGRKNSNLSMSAELTRVFLCEDLTSFAMRTLRTPDKMTSQMKVMRPSAVPSYLNFVFYFLRPDWLPTQFTEGSIPVSAPSAYGGITDQPPFFDTSVRDLAQLGFQCEHTASHWLVSRVSFAMDYSMPSLPAGCSVAPGNASGLSDLPTKSRLSGRAGTEFFPQLLRQ